MSSRTLNDWRSVMVEEAEDGYSDVSRVDSLAVALAVHLAGEVVLTLADFAGPMCLPAFALIDAFIT